MGRAKQRAAEIAALKAKGPKVKEVPVVPTTEVTEPVQINPLELEAQRRAMWRGAIEQELQLLVGKASEVRKNIDEATTKVKVDLYTKKFKKIQEKVMQMVTALQRIQAQEAAVKAAANVNDVDDIPIEAGHVHDENCHHTRLHEHKEEQNGNANEVQPASS